MRNVRRLESRRKVRKTTYDACKKILIVVEGKTERNYFRQFKTRNLTVNVMVHNPDPTDALGLIKECIRLIGSNDLRSYKDQATVVFDADTVDRKTMDEVIRISEMNNIGVYISNRCFEHWLMLHFKDFGKALDEDDMKHELSKVIGTRYEKGDAGICRHFTDERKLDAIERARRQLNGHDDPESCYNTCPSTNVFKLVKNIMEENSDDIKARS